ncbi:MAG: SPFH domain-containing protein [Planctomycetes bacterium]|nr:SPFH domain-containing protein [Planctomycetota bacterium]
MEEALKQVVSTRRAEDSIKERGRVKDETFRRVAEALGGLMTVNDLVITNIDLSDELERAIERKQVAEQQALAMDYELRREEKAAEIQIVKAEAEAKAIAIRGAALLDSPMVILLNAIDKWDGKAPSTLAVGSDAGIALIPREAAK